MRAYRMLLWREARQAAPAEAAYLLGIAVWTAFLASRIGRWHDGAVIALAQVPFWTLPPWALWRAFHGLRQDYATPHAHLLLSLPVPGWQLASAKLLVIWAEVVVYGVAAGAALLALLRQLGLPGLPPGLHPTQLALVQGALFRSAAALVLLALLVGAPAWLAVAQAAWVVGRASPWAQGLVSGIAFFAGVWLLLRAGIAAPAVLGWLPHLPLLPYVDFAHLGGGQWAVEPRLLAIHPAPLVGAAAAALALFAGSARLLERQLDAGAGALGTALAVLVVAWFVAVVIVGLVGFGFGFELVDRLVAAFRPTEVLGR